MLTPRQLWEIGEHGQAPPKKVPLNTLAPVENRKPKEVRLGRDWHQRKVKDLERANDE